MNNYDQTIKCRWCGNEGSEKHHLFRRSAEPSLIDDPKNKVILCRFCHEYATNVKSFETLLVEKFFLREEKELSLENIQNQMRAQEQLSPKEVSDFRRFLAGEYSYNGELLQYVEKNKPEIWLELRKQCKSDTQADRKWEMEPAGITEQELKMKMKRCEKLLSALRTISEIYNNEARNNY